MNIKNISLTALLCLTYLSSINASPSTFTNPIKSEIKSEKTPFGKFKTWKQKKRSAIQRFLLRDFISEDIANIHLLEGCEKITFKNREVYEVEIISMDDLKIVYKLCRGGDNEEKVISLSEVSTIYDADGDVIFKSGSSSRSESKILTYSILSLAAALLALLFPLGILFGPLAIIFGAIALRKIKARNNGDKTNKGLALGGLISGIVITALTLLVFGILFIVGWW